MKRLKALKISLIVSSLLFLLAPTSYFLFMPDAYRWAPYSQPYEHLIVALYAALAICLLVARRDPFAHRIIIDFAVLSSLFAGVSMTYNALIEPAEIIHLFIEIPFFYAIAGLFIFLYPRGPQADSE